MKNNRTVIVATVGMIALAAGWFARGTFVSSRETPADATARPGMTPPVVIVQTVQVTPVPVATEIIARVEPIQTAHIRTEISGKLTAVHFTEGAQVEEGAPLFTIEPDQYQATVLAREADLERAKAEQVRAHSYLARSKGADARSISRTALETAEADLLRAEAGKKQARANLDLARIALAHTEIMAPISGRIGPAMMTRGNIVNPASGPLARIVQTNPVRVMFSLADRDFLQQQWNNPESASRAREARVRLPDGTMLPTVGHFDFADNVMNPDTGSIAVYYRFDNQDELLVPGSHVTVLLEKPEPEAGIAIPQKAVLNDAQGAYVLTVAPNNIVMMARVVPGVQVGADIVILSGLMPETRIIVEGVQKAYPGFPVQPLPPEDGE